MWGQVYRFATADEAAGIIPTRVGTRYTHSMELCAYGDHPHACGDKCQCRTSLKICRGSSPRVWGQVVYRIWCAKNTRIIPTRVGTRVETYEDLAGCWDHPHACGDKVYGVISKNRQRGSSPRVWGQVFLSFASRLQPRIIPTRVGTSNYCHFASIRVQDHPHACGDKLVALVC